MRRARSAFVPSALQQPNSESRRIESHIGHDPFVQLTLSPTASLADVTTSNDVPSSSKVPTGTQRHVSSPTFRSEYAERIP